MKICSQCNGAQPDDAEFCALCGAPLTEQPAEETAAPEAEPQTEEAAAPEAEPQTEEAASQATKKVSTGLVIALILVVLLVVAVIVGKGRYDQSQSQSPSVQDGTSVDLSGSLLLGHHINAHGYGSYSVHYEKNDEGIMEYSYLNESGETVTMGEADVAEKMDEVLATCGDMTLTNRELQYYYEQQFYSFYSMYSSYLSYFMNTAQGLDEQLDLSGEGTWQQSFLTGAVDMFHQIAALCQQGQAEGFTLTDEQQAQIDSATDLQATAAQYGYEDIKAFFDDYMPPFATQESYKKYVEQNLYANFYASYLSEQIELTDSEIEAYYDENAETYASSYGITKLDKNVVNVRHILIQPESTMAEDGTSTVTDEAWAAAEEEAQRIYQLWLDGDATEESFAQLAEEYTQDPGSQTTGGLYEDVYPGQMVAEFNDWCFADGRQVGDHGVVKTSYGYHIMFFSGEGDYIYWRMVAESQLRSQKASEERNVLADGYALMSDLSNAILMDATAPSAPVEAVTE